MKQYFRCLICFFALAILIPAHALAEEDPSRVFEPIKITSSALSVLDAIRLTLEHDPNIKLERETTEIKKGELQYERGAFDTRLLLDAEGSFIQTELGDKFRKDERKKRERLREIIEQRGRADKMLVAMDSYLEAQANDINYDGSISDLLPADTSFTPVENLEMEKAENSFGVQNAYYEDWMEIKPADADEIEIRRQAAIALNREEFLLEMQENLEKKAESERELKDLGGVPKTREETKVLLDLYTKKTFRSGVDLSTGVKVTKDAWRYRHKDLEETPVYTSEFRFDIQIPLGKGRGMESSGAREMAADISYKASLLTLQHTISKSIFTTAIAYWELVAAQNKLELYKKSAESQERLLELSQAMVDTDELPRAELARVKAREANTRAILSDAKKTLHQARLNMAQTIGLSVAGIENAPLASDIFPTPPESPVPDSLHPSSFVNRAVDFRQDHKAALKHQESARVLLRAAQIDLKPQADFGLKLSYSGADEDANIKYGLDGVLFRDLTGPSFSGRFNLDWPLKNNRARGNLVKASAKWQKNQIIADDLKRTIKSKVVHALESLKETVVQLTKNHEAAHYYKTTWDNEMEKYKAGSSTLTDTILTEEQLTDALQALVIAQAQYAKFLTHLRFETATFFRYDSEGHKVREDDLITIPFVEGGLEN